MKMVFNKAMIWWIILIMIVFGPLLFLLGFGISDDLSLVGHLAPNFWTDLGYSLSRPGHLSRPIYGLIQTTTLHLFKEHYIFYNVVRISLWFAIVFQARKVFYSYFKGSSIWIFLFFMSLPVFSTAHLFNFFQMGYLLSLLFYLLALGYLKDIDGGFTRKKYFHFLLFGLLAMLSCEIVFPLFIFPIAYNYKGNLKEVLHSRLLRWSILIFVIYFVFKFLIGPIYQNESGIYGFAPSLHSVLQSIYYFVVILVEIPMLLLEVIPFFYSEPLLWLSVLVVPFIYVIKSQLEFNLNRRLIYSMLITLASCSLIFVVSNYPAVSFGLYNKMMLPAHLCYSILIAIFCLYILKSRFYFVSYIIAVLWFASMQMQTINSIHSWDHREGKLIEYADLLNKDELRDSYVFIEAPYFLNSNYNNEHVFALNDDFQGGLSLYGYEGNANNVFPFCLEMLENPSYWSNHNLYTVIQNKGIKQFKIVQDGEVLNGYFDLTSLKNRSFKSNNECLRSKIRNYLIQKMKGK